MNRILATTLLVLMLFGREHHADTIPNARHTPAPPAESCAILAADGAWCWFADPRAVYYEGTHKRTYAGYVARPEGTVAVTFLDHVTKKMETVKLRTFERDDHANPALLFLPDGRLMVFYCGHREKDVYYRVTERPEDISSWSEERTIGVNTPGEGNSYPNPVILKKENNRIYLVWRGGNRQFCYATSDNGVDWSPARELIRAGRVPYVKVYSTGADSIHFAFTNDHPEYDADNNLYYACYRNGRFFRADGSLIKDTAALPLTPQDADVVYDSSVSGRAWVWDLATDEEGHPVIVYTVSINREGTRYVTSRSGIEHRYRYARWNGESWDDSELTSAGSWFPETPPGTVEKDPYYTGGIALHHGNTSIVYLSKPTRGVFEIERWAMDTDTRTWKHDSVTADSTRNNVRPFVPHGSPPGSAALIWMHGKYTSYTDFQTELRMR